MQVSQVSPIHNEIYNENDSCNSYSTSTTTSTVYRIDSKGTDSVVSARGL